MDLSRRSILAGGAAFATAAKAAPHDHATVPETAARLDRAVSETLTAGACPGVQLAVARNGTTIYSRGYGTANLETRTPVGENTIFRIGSLTKQFTAACILKLAAENRLQLEVPVARYLPFMSRLKPVSLLELLHHTAGLHEDGEVGAGAGKPELPASQIAQAEEIARQRRPFDFDPGTAWLYSNANYIVLGGVIESATKEPFARAIADVVLRPLGLSATAVDRAADVVIGRASGYAPRKPGGSFENARCIEVAEAGGAGAMRSRALDLCRWHALLLSNRLFGRKYIDLMLAPGRLRDGRVSGANRFSPSDASYGDVQYACGLFISAPSDPHPSILHYGAIDGFAAVLQTYLKAGVTFAVLCNGDIGPAMPFRAIRKIVEQNFLPR